MNDTLTLTCDRHQNLIRLAIWQGSRLRDLYLDHLDKPDPTGGVVCGKVDRLVAGGGGAWVEAGLSEPIFIEKGAALKAGQKVVVEIRSTARQGKAHQGFLRQEAVPSDEESGFVVLPPKPWQRALMDFKNDTIASLTFSNKEDYTACEAFLQKVRPELVAPLKPLSKESVHPDLDDVIEDLQSPKILLGSATSLIIEETEALIAIDINAEKGGNALSANLAAAQEIARQIRLRNLGGILIIDALKMPKRVDTAKLLNALKRATASDPAGVDVFGMTKLGLVEMTRRRRGPSLREIMGA